MKLKEWASEYENDFIILLNFINLILIPLIFIFWDYSEDSHQ